MSFQRQMEQAPSFAREFIEKVECEFYSNFITYTRIPDMRIRRTTNNSRNAVTIKWQPQKKRFLLATPLSPVEVRSCGITAEVSKRIDPLPFSFYVDEAIINRKTPEILKVLKSAHRYEL